MSAFHVCHPSAIHTTLSPAPTPTPNAHAHAHPTCSNAPSRPAIPPPSNLNHIEASSQHLCSILSLLCARSISHSTEDVDAYDGRGHASSLPFPSLYTSAPSLALRALTLAPSGPPTRCLRKLPLHGHRHCQQRQQQSQYQQ
jgi:hypothetical protein